jgi:flagellar hook protein FlgE
MSSINNTLHTAISGLASNSDGMNVISNNIANANTKSFKADRAEFEDLLSISLGKNSQLGRGARLRNIETIFNQGAISNSGQITDLAIQGDGFFVIKSDQSEVKESNGLFYTRQGSFRFDKDGKLTDPSGGRVQGYMAENGDPNKLSPKLSDMQIITNNIPPKETNVVNIVANLDVREKPPTTPFDPARAKETSNFVTAVTIFDNFGYGRQAYVYFSKSPDASKNAWEWHAVVDGSEMSNTPAKDEKGKPIPVQIGQGKIEFDSQGNPILPFTTKNGDSVQADIDGKTDAFDVQFANGSKPQKLQFNFGPSIGADGKIGTQGSTSIAAKSGVSFHSQDGFETGYLKSIKIELDGSVRGIYTNGLERRLGAVALASFTNNHGLEKIGRNNYAYSPKAGEPRIGLPQSGSRGSIYSSSLEESNVDLAQQFVDMIVTQRAFQASSKSVTTTDTMLEEVINIKR